MNTKEMIKWLEANIRTSFLPQIWGKESDDMLRAIIKSLQHYDILKAYLHKDVLDEVERLEEKRRTRIRGDSNG